MRVPILAVAIFLAANLSPQPSRARQYSYTVVRAYPHDPAAFTQGLEYHDGVLYEGTGLNGKSSIRKVKLETGEVLQRRDVPAEHFGEGIAVWKSDLYELTWQSHLAFVYDVNTFAPRRSFTYPGEGWGLTHDGESLIMSDGSPSLRFIDPATFTERRRVVVSDGGLPIARLNELEYVKGEIFANVWMTDTIVRIAPDTGRVTGRIDLTGLLPEADRPGPEAGAVLNGIAYDEQHDRLFVTGKRWPKLFEIKVR